MKFILFPATITTIPRLIQSHFRFFFFFLSFFAVELVRSSLFKLSDSIADTVFASMSILSSISVASFSSLESKTIETFI